MSAHDAMMALARDLVEEIAAGMALELAAGPAPAEGHHGTVPVRPLTPGQVPVPPRRNLTGAAAVHPQLGQALVTRPGDTISGLAYRHLLPPAPPPGTQPGGQPGMPRPPIAGQ